MQRKNAFRNGLKQVCAAYEHAMENRGFYVLVTICVLVILFSALYTFHFRKPEVPLKTETTDQISLPAGGMQDAQTLLEAQSLIASSSAVHAPQEPPLTFSQPAEGIVCRDFSMVEPQYFSAPNYWRVHPGIDFLAEYGAPVKACSDGSVVSVWEDAEMGLCILLQHKDGYQSLYAGLSNAGYVQESDPVSQGQTIGHVGNGVAAESDAEPHLHFEIRKGSTPADPVPLFLGLGM